MKLRPYQIEGKNAVSEKFKQGHRRIIFRLSTGGGKSNITAVMATEAVQRGKTVLIVADRKELIGQLKRQLHRIGINPIIIDPSWRGQTGPCYVASIQTLNRRDLPLADLILIDEAHKNAFKKVLENQLYDMSYLVGFTATPISTPKFDLSNYYEVMVEGIEIDELIKQGFLVNAKYFAAWESFGKIKMRGEDYDEKELFDKFNKRSMYDGMIEAYEQHTPNTKAICFCISIEHAVLTTKEFNERGIKAVCVVSDPQYCTDAQRVQAFKDFEEGDALILVNQGIATVGYDYPPTQTIILNRKTKSLALYLQMIGRGSRPFQSKEYFNIIDMGSNIIEHGWYDDIREWSLYPKKKSSGKKGIAPIKECGNKECGCLVPAVTKICKFCGYEFPHEVERLATTDGIVEVKKEKLPEIPQALLGKRFGQMTIAELELVRSVKGYKIGWIIHQLEERGEQSLEEYGKLKGYKHGWEQHHKHSSKSKKV